MSFQPKVDTNGLKLRRGFVDLACEKGAIYECQRKPESRIRGQGDSAEHEVEVFFRHRLVDICKSSRYPKIRLNILLTSVY